MLLRQRQSSCVYRNPQVEPYGQSLSPELLLFNSVCGGPKLGQADLWLTRESNSALQEAIRQLSETWRRKLTSLDRRNPTLYFRPLKVGTLQLPSAETEEVKAFVNESRALDLPGVMEWTSDSSKRLTAIRAKAKENDEERGIQTMFVAIGMATWKSSDGGAPVFFLPVAVSEPARRPRLTRNGDLLINRVMLQAWEEEHKHKILPFDPDEPIESAIDHALGKVGLAGKALEEFSILPECFLGNFSFAKMAMVEDLRRNEHLLLQNRLVSAIAGDPAALQSIKDDAGTVPRDELDEIDPAKEIIVLEADEYQRQAIHSLTQFYADGVIDGPPGTGKSQTIANLIASLVATGQRVLFVAEKRAALDAVLKRLAAAGLDDFVLDLHGADSKRKAVYDRLRRRDEKARFAEDQAPAAGSKNLKKLRGELNAYYRAVNSAVGGSGMTVREIIARLSTLESGGEPQTLWFGADLEKLTVEVHEEALRCVGLISHDAPLFKRDQGVPWSNTDFEDQEAAAKAIQAVMESRLDIERMRRTIVPVARATNLDAASFDDLEKFGQSIKTIREVRDTFDDAILEENLRALEQALSPIRKNIIMRSWFFLFNKSYRSALRCIRRNAKSAVSPPLALSTVVSDCLGLQEPFRQRSVFALITPAYVVESLPIWKRVHGVRKRIKLETNEELPDGLDLSLLRLSELEAASRSARRIPDVRRAERGLEGAGYGALASELSRTEVRPDLWANLADHAWLRSHLEKAKSDEPALGGFSREKFEKLRLEFQELDQKQLGNARAAVRRGAAQAYLQAKNHQPDQAILFRAELQKKARNMPIRRLVERAGTVVTALCPCWMASPLSVSQLIPGKRAIFDVVIFDEASQILPEDGVPSIMRGNRTVVAGDQKQLPPTVFFAAGGSDPEDDEEDEPEGDLAPISTEGMESILDVMLTFCNRQYLNVHYRSLQESLIRFSNHEFYLDRLITFPSADIEGGGLSHVLVDSPYIDGEELSSSSEIARIVDLVFDHAVHRADESLGVISLGIKHARRLEAAIELRRRESPDVEDFFAKSDVNKAFFVKNLERVQGDERDAIILSFGYAKDAAGRLKNKLGPINYSGGQRRLNVAVTRAKTRLTAVSTFTESDMDPARFSSTGAQVLCRYLAYARSSGTRLDGVAQLDVEINDFERDVMDSLSARGLILVPQLGVSKYRLDFAVRHPKIPNRFVLAIECDGAPYHSSATARDRDRLRQTYLENRGWRFHRIWSLDWYEERAAEIKRAVEAYSNALRDASMETKVVPSRPVGDGDLPTGPRARERGPRPRVPFRNSVLDYTDSELLRVVEWVCGDGILRSDEELIADMIPALGFHRRGRLIDERLRSVIRRRRR